MRARWAIVVALCLVWWNASQECFDKCHVLRLNWHICGAEPAHIVRSIFEHKWSMVYRRLPKFSVGNAYNQQWEYE